MKPITTKYQGLIWKAQRDDLNAPFRKPAPFPGKYPTRVYLRAGKWKYIGKPSLNVYRTFIKLIPQSPYDYASIEFDTETVLYGVKRNGERGMTKSIYHEQLWAVYHPQSIAHYLMTWMGYGIKTLGHRYVIGASGIKGVR